MRATIDVDDDQTTTVDAAKVAVEIDTEDGNLIFRFPGLAVRMEMTGRDGDVLARKIQTALDRRPTYRA